MDATAILALVSTGIKVLAELISIGKTISPQVVALVNAIKTLVDGDVSDEAVANLRAAIIAVNEENAAMEDAILGKDEADGTASD